MGFQVSSQLLVNGIVVTVYSIYHNIISWLKISILSPEFNIISWLKISILSPEFQLASQARSQLTSIGAGPCKRLHRPEL